MSRSRPCAHVGGRRLWPGRGQADAGSVTVMTVGYLVILLVLAFVVAEASIVYLARRSLAAECDGAAVAAAQSVDAARTYGRADPGTTLALAGVQAVVTRYPRRPDSSLVAAVEGGDTVVVTGRRAVDLPLLRSLGVGAVTVSANARAKTHVLVSEG
ncbi:MAG: pilus assembly protein TadG-related protein [Frankiaceae bacterium]